MLRPVVPHTDLFKISLHYYKFSLIIVIKSRKKNDWKISSLWARKSQRWISFVSLKSKSKKNWKQSTASNWAMEKSIGADVLLNKNAHRTQCLQLMDVVAFYYHPSLNRLSWFRGCIRNDCWPFLASSVVFISSITFENHCQALRRIINHFRTLTFFHRADAAQRQDKLKSLLAKKKR